jgi:hypothetical protein
MVLMGFRRFLGDVRFWILFLFVIRLVGITNPPLEVGHNWRQTTVTMVARNFYEIEPNILYPRIDIAGEKSGITGMEFPVLNYIIYLVSKVFGYTHWYGRLINLVVSSFGLWFFFLLTRRYFGEKVGLYATLILGFSVWFQFSRKIMPDTFSMSLILASIYYGVRYLENKSRGLNMLNLVVYFLTMSLAVLSKLPSGYILVVFGVFILDRKIALYRKFWFGLVSVVGLIPVYYWYYEWVPYLVETYGFWHFFMGKSMYEGLAEIMTHIPETLSRFYETAMQFTGFGMFLLGLIWAIKYKNWSLLYIVIVCLLGFSVIILKAGFTFYHHSYYIIPFVPIMALVAGFAISKIKNSKLLVVILLAIGVEGIASQYQDFFIPEKKLRILQLEADLDSVSNPKDLILINSGKYPTTMYFAHRKGWIEYNEKIKDINYLNELKTKGIKYIVILKDADNVVLPNFKKVKENSEYTIYSVE